MGFGLGSPDLALYRLLKGGESGLNLSLNDLYDRIIIIPNLYEIVKSFFTRKKIIVTIKAYPNKIINRLQTIQRGVDKEIERKIQEAKSKGAV